ncbi:23S rRNA (uracil(1939)-C(5))-methyltransferase RlmD [Pedobacter sp. MC2016-14]|uniref:23S rRNA (uracil(1939)-C(5))-methyltransferase RlmD n=1 Tax=Pedobacter sp. MC2016-14 TaxID=2897327 RepID=UPI001E505AF7|nr:23S rRNA (uracil(1939)-C(5))-methyltransferase RlmD [Pedobacter sp. MC2016-14]MCD0486614.1 23S rRNA (uracil(1939)-C(5))-methyltransferase RlmD [Pedobacter sp. MC2016-14]
MSRNRKAGTVTILPNIHIIDIAEEGKGVGKAEELVVFVDKAVPGDVADVRIVKKKKNLAEAVIETLHTSSELRTDPFCQHFGTCGGCKWQHMQYDAQLKFKYKNVEAALQRLGKIDTTGMEPILGSAANKYYRNKLEYTFSNKRWLNKQDMESVKDAEDIDRQPGEVNEALEMNALGFHVPLRFDKILDIQHCYLQAEPSNTLRNQVRNYALRMGLTFYDLRNHEGNLRNLIIRTSSTGEVMVVVVFAYAEQEQVDGLMEYLRQNFPEITSLLYIMNQKKNDTIFDQEVITYAGRDHIFEEMDGLKFKIGAKSFYQTNSEQAHELYKITREFAGFRGDELVYDLYTGAGTIANFVARQVKQVVGVEYVPTAIEDAKFNSNLNGIDNTIFYAGDMKDILTTDFINAHGKPDVVITDPPRAGMHADVVQRLLEMEAEKIVYVSCNAATQARDLALMKAKYNVVRIKPVDMFPHTQHVENVVLLQLKTEEERNRIIEEIEVITTL